MQPNPFQEIQVIFFDFMGTCLDWHTNIVKTLPERLTISIRSDLALAWRQSFFDDIHDRFVQGLPAEDIDVTHARLFDDLICQRKWSDIKLDEEEKKCLVNAWHHMTAWPDVTSGLTRLKRKYEVFVLANGTTRLQLDLTRSSKLSFDMLFSSQLLQFTKPDPKIYEKALELVGCKASKALMIAAHAYDLRAAQKIGMKTAYIKRWTEDQEENMGQVEDESDAFVDGRSGTVDCGLVKIADLLGV